MFKLPQDLIRFKDIGFGLTVRKQNQRMKVESMDVIYFMWLLMTCENMKKKKYISAHSV